VGTITALRFQKRNRNRVSVYVDDRFAFGLAAIEAARLKVGQTLDENQVARLREQDQVERGYERALNFLSYRPRSREEVRRNLRKKIKEENVEAVIARLTRTGLLDDREFARYWVDNRIRFNPRGARALRQELWEKGIADEIISEVLEGFEEEEAARRAAEAGARRLAGAEPKDFCRRLAAYMTRRGFSYGVTRPLIDEMLQVTRCEDLSDIESEGEDNE
jgi:regulatory protein